LRVEGLGLRVEGRGLRVQGPGSRVQGPGSRVPGVRPAPRERGYREVVAAEARAVGVRDPVEGVEGDSVCRPHLVEGLG